MLKLSKKLPALGLAATLFAPAANALTLWVDSFQNFSHTQGANGLSYGYTDGNPNNFTPFTEFNPDDIWDGGWVLCAPSTAAPCVDSNNAPLSNLLASSVALHPEGATATSAQVNWISNTTGRLTLVGLFGGNASGGGSTTATIYFNGISILEQPFADNRNIRDFTLVLDFNVGDVLSFAASAPTGNSVLGTTGYYFQVWGPDTTVVPLPPAAGLFGAALIGAAAISRRQKPNLG